MSIVPVSIPSPCTAFLYFVGKQKHEDGKLGTMNNKGKCRLVKVIFSNIHKIKDACANSFGIYIMVVQCMRNVFILYYIQLSVEKRFFCKIKAHLPQHPQIIKTTV